MGSDDTTYMLCTHMHSGMTMSRACVEGHHGQIGGALRVAVNQRTIQDRLLAEH